MTLDLNNNYTISGGVSVENGADLTVIGKGAVAGTLEFDTTSQGQLKGGKFVKLICNNPNKTLLQLLAEGYAYWNSTMNWKVDVTGNSTDSVEVRLAPIRELGITNGIGELTYGYSAGVQYYIQVNATLQGTYTENMVEYRWYKVDENGVESSELASTEQQFSIPEGLAAGIHTYRVHVSCREYTLKADVTFKVSKAASTVAAVPTAQELTYTGQDQQLVTAGTTSDGTMVYSLEKEGTYTSNIPTGKAVGEYTVWYKV